MTQATPQTAHRLPVERRFPLAECPAEADRLLAATGDLEGCLSVRLEREPLRLSVGYDAMQTDCARLHAQLVALGWPRAAGRWERWKIGFYAYQDANMRDNALHQPACCNRPPR